MRNSLKRNKYQFQQMDLDKNNPRHKYMNQFNKLKNKLLSQDNLNAVKNLMLKYNQLNKI